MPIIVDKRGSDALNAFINVVNERHAGWDEQILRIANTIATLEQRLSHLEQTLVRLAAKERGGGPTAR